MSIYKDNPKVRGYYIFKLRIVNEVKGKETLTLYKKLRLIV